MKGKIINLEGLDGCGKTEQCRLLRKYFADNNIPAILIKFPQYNSFYGKLISAYLRGEYGDLKSVNPYLIQNLYADDRRLCKDTLIEWLKEDVYVIIDRYVLSMAYALARMDTFEFACDFLYLEYKINEMPRPNISFYLSNSIDFIKNNLEKNRCGDERKYLNGKNDIHESDIDYQYKVHEAYLKLVSYERNFKLIDCENLDIMSVHKKILEELKNNNII